MAFVSLIDSTGIGYLLGSILCFAIAIVTYDDFFQCDYIQIRDSSEWTVSSGYTTSQFIALVIACITLPLGIIQILIFAVQSFKNVWSFSLKLLLYFLLSVLGGGAVWLSYGLAGDVLSCGVFCFGSNGTQNDINDAAIIFIGLVYFFLSSALTLLFTWLFILTIATGGTKPASKKSYESSQQQQQQQGYGATDSADDVEEKPLLASSRPNPYLMLASASKKRYKIVFAMFTVFLILYPLLIFACTVLPTWWSKFSKFDIQRYQVSE